MKYFAESGVKYSYNDDDDDMHGTDTFRNMKRMYSRFIYACIRVHMYVNVMISQRIEWLDFIEYSVVVR